MSHSLTPDAPRSGQIGSRSRAAARRQATPLLALAPLLVAWPLAARGADRPGARRSAEVARCEIVIILGQAKRSPLPASLARFRGDLAGGPFKRFGSFALLGKRRLTLRTPQRSRRDLVGPYRFEGRLLGRSPRRAARSQIRFEAYLYRHRPGHKDRRLLRTRLLATAGTTVLLAGPRYGRGRLIFALTCR